MKEKIIRSLKSIYSKIPKTECQHCHKCCGPIIWFEPEEILIKEYMKKNNIKRIQWTTKEFEQNNMKCPYLSNDRCIIYPVRPIVCRLQGNIVELKCKSSEKTNMMSNEELDKIRKRFIKLLKQTNGLNSFYSTHLISC